MAAEAKTPFIAGMGPVPGGLEGKYLTFALGDEEYGFGILQVREIIGLMDITFVPQAPCEVRGVINLRGKVIPVVDLRVKFGMPQAEPTDETCIIVVDVRGILVGALVDSVAEVLAIGPGDIEPAPAVGAEEDEIVTGMGKVKGKVKILLDVEKALASSGVISGGIEDK